MLILSGEYKMKLVNKIVGAASQEEVNNFVEAAMKAWENSEVNSQLIPGFIETIVHDLELSNPIKKDAQQWSNIKFALILFNRIRNRLNAGVC